jgi:hypothetical protein
VRELLWQVALDDRLRKLLLTAYDREAILLELSPARATVAERLPLEVGGHVLGRQIAHESTRSEPSSPVITL